MADVTISNLPTGAPAGNALLPYSQGGNTLSVPVSALFQNAGNIGIGTAIPVIKQEIVASGSGIVRTLALTNYNNEPDVGSVLEFRNSILNNVTWLGANIQSVRIGATAGHALVFNTKRDGQTFEVTTEAMRISQGNVGIGTATPTSKLHISGDARVTGDLKVDSGYIDTSGTTVSLANNAYIDFPLASGLLIVNCMTIDGSVSAYLVGGTGVVRLGTSIGNPPGTVTFVNADPPFYRFTNTFGVTQSFSFCFIKTRSYA